MEGGRLSRRGLIYYGGGSPITAGGFSIRTHIKTCHPGKYVQTFNLLTYEACFHQSFDTLPLTYFIHGPKLDLLCFWN